MADLLPAAIKKPQERLIFFAENVARHEVIQVGWRV
jgi:hypothetical protein